MTEETATRSTRARKLTDKFCESAKAIDGKDTSYSDLVVTGLALRVKVTGIKSWAYRYTTTRTAKGKRVKMTLGQFPAMGLSDARSEAAKIAKRVSDGADPSADAERLRKSVTFKGLAERMLVEHPTLADTTKVQYRYMLIRHVYPAIGELPAAAVTRDDVHKLLSAIQASGSAPDRKVKRQNLEAADYAKAAIGSVYKFARKANVFGEVAVVNPALGLGRRSEAQPRLNPLPDATIRIVWHAIDEAKARPSGKGLPRNLKGYGASLCPAIGDALRLLFLTGCRRSEVVEARVSEFDLSSGLWTIPGDTKIDGRIILGRTKNGAAKFVPLPRQAIEIVREAIKRAGNSAFLFPSPSSMGGEEDCPIKPLSTTRAFERLIVTKQIPGKPHLHDTRAACRTWLKDEEFSREVRDAVLGHLGEGIGAKRYEAPSMKFINNQVKPALQAWADHVDAVVNNSST